MLHLPSRNKVWGFFGSFLHNTGQDSPGGAAAAFDSVLTDLVRRYGMSEIDARDFLDSKCGRHLADATVGSHGFVANYPTWLGKETKRWRKDN